MPDDRKPHQNGPTIWDRVAESHEFRDLMATKKIFIVPRGNRICFYAWSLGRACCSFWKKRRSKYTFVITRNLYLVQLGNNT
jgi:hypothetical protein